MNKDYIFGTRAIIEAIEAEKEIDRLLVSKTSDNELHKELQQKARKANIPTVFVPIEKLNRVTRKNHQGAIAYLNLIQYASLDHILDQLWTSGGNPLFIILDRITDTRNLGAIARTAECIGADALIVPEKSSARIGPDAIKTSAGALHHIPVCRVKSIEGVVRSLKDQGLEIIGLTEKAEGSLYKKDLTIPLGLVMGSEDTGMDEKVMSSCSDIVKLPMVGKIGSLNVSVAAGVAMFEVLRQRD